MIKFVRPFLITIFFIISVLSFWSGLKVLSSIHLLQFAPAFTRVFVDFSILALLVVVLNLFAAYFWGKFYCSTFCMFGIFQDIISWITGKESGKKLNLYFIRYSILILAVLSVWLGIPMLLKFVEPYSLMGNIITDVINYKNITIATFFPLLIIIFIVAYKGRIFCTTICPVGTILGLCSKYGYNKLCINENCIKCGQCEKACPTGAINIEEKNIDNEICIRCLKCMQTCSSQAIKLEHKKEVIKFQPSRRNFITTGIVLTCALGILAKGKEIVKLAANTIKKLSICPPGSTSTEELKLKCTNCGLCVEHCKGHVLQNPDNNYDTVHLDFTKGQCEYDCKNCSDVCPTGAIKKMTLEEKQSCKIGLATFNRTLCTKCGQCSGHCPTGAIVAGNDKSPVFDETKCIGCGTCEYFCTSSCIKIIPLNEQEFVV